MSESILIVDDEQSLRYMLRSLLARVGYTVVEAASGEHALEALNEAFVDLVITDLKMPGMDGLSLARRLLEAEPDRPVLLMTAYADLDSARRAVGMGIYEFFTKPFDVNDVLAGVRRALDRRRLVQENFEYQKALEWKVKERTQELRRASEDLASAGRLSAGAAHEALSALLAALGRIDMALRTGGTVERHRRSLTIAQEGLLRAAEIMDNLLSLQPAPPLPASGRGAGGDR